MIGNTYPQFINDTITINIIHIVVIDAYIVRIAMAHLQHFRCRCGFWCVTVLDIIVVVVSVGYIEAKTCHLKIGIVLL